MEELNMAENSAARMLHEELGQHLVGTLLAAGALKARLTRRQAPEAAEAAYILDMLKKANQELDALIVHLESPDRSAVIDKRTQVFKRPPSSH